MSRVHIPFSKPHSHSVGLVLVVDIAGPIYLTSVPSLQRL